MKLLALVVWSAAAALASDDGRDWGVERTSSPDPVTGVRIHEMALGGNLYFHFSNFTADNRYIILASDRSGSPQIFRVGVADGRIVQLTAEAGVAAHGACPDPTEPRRVYYTRGADVYAVDVETFESRKIGTAPGAWLGGMQQPSLSGDGLWLTIGGQRDAITWEIGLLNTSTGAYRTVSRPGFRIGHVQHSPTDPLIFYVWETGGYAPQRSWVVNSDGSGNRPFYASVDPKQWATPLKEWMTHEAWVANTGDMTMIGDRIGVFLVHKDGAWKILREGSFWHAAAQPDGQRLVLDDQQNRLWLLDTTTGSLRLLATAVRKKGDGHVHPSFDHQGRYVLFNSTRTGKATVAIIDLRELPAP